MLKLQSSAWMWIAAVYGFQTLGAVGLTFYLGLPLAKPLAGILLLLSGAVVSLVLAFHHDTSSGRSWKMIFPALIYALFIFVMSHKSWTQEPVPFNTDLLHPVEYASLGIFLSWAGMPILTKKGLIWFVAVVVLAGTFYGMADEFHQSFVPGRDASLLDVGLDVIGVSLGCGLFLIALKLGRRFTGKGNRGGSAIGP